MSTAGQVRDVFGHVSLARSKSFRATAAASQRRDTGGRGGYITIV